jgi:hypothetical protein
MAGKQQRDWAQLDAFEAEYAERLQAEAKRRKASGRSQFLEFLDGLAQNYEHFYADEINARDPETGRLFALRTKLSACAKSWANRRNAALRRAGVGQSAEQERSKGAASNAQATSPPKATTSRRPDQPSHRVRPRPAAARPSVSGHAQGHQSDAGRTAARTRPNRVARPPDQPEAHRNRRRLARRRDSPALSACPPRAGRGTPPVGRTESTQDVERFGGRLEWDDNNKLYAVWPIEAYKTFVLRRVLIHEVAHSVAELPGYAERVRAAGSVEKFCEQYAENFYRPAGKSVRLGF